MREKTERMLKVITYADGHKVVVSMGGPND